MAHVDYIGNVTRLAVELVNAGHADDLTHETADLLAQHEIERPDSAALDGLLDPMRAALEQLVDAAPPEAVSALLVDFPPELQLSDHDHTGSVHLHFARNGLPPREWIGQTVAAALAYVATSESGLTLGRCAAGNCRNFFVDQSRNRTRRFCGNACASRTTVAAHRARTHAPRRT